MILPTVINISNSSIKAVPSSLRSALGEAMAINMVAGGAANKEKPGNEFFKLVSRLFSTLPLLLKHF